MITLNGLIVIDVHAKDVVEGLVYYLMKVQRRNIWCVFFWMGFLAALLLGIGRVGLQMHINKFPLWIRVFR
jgi:hypothetical protein